MRHVCYNAPGALCIETCSWSIFPNHCAFTTCSWSILPIHCAFTTCSWSIFPIHCAFTTCSWSIFGLEYNYRLFMLQGHNILEQLLLEQLLLGYNLVSKCHRSVNLREFALILGALVLGKVYITSSYRPLFYSKPYRNVTLLLRLFKLPYVV